MTEFISRNYGKEGYEIIIKTDSHEHYRATEDFARRLIDNTKPMRIVDKIRAMSDEDFAAILRVFCIEMADCIDCPLYRFGCPKSSAFNDWMKWLRQPVEGE